MPQDQRLLRPIKKTDGGGPIGPPPPAVTYRILQEDGFKILTESGNPLRKEQRT
jgi:hypothetical protein